MRLPGLAASLLVALAPTWASAREQPEVLAVEPAVAPGDRPGPVEDGAEEREDIAIEGASNRDLEASAEGPGDARLDRLERRLDELARENEALREELGELRENQEYTEERVKAMQPLTGKVSGYVDMGFFWAQGDGAGTRTDIGNVYFPEYAGVVPDSWVFMGDPLSTAVNSRGEPADTGESRAVTFDSVNNGGKASFLLNSLNLNLFAGIGEYATVEGLIDFVPRNRDVSDPDGVGLGDFIDVQLAYAKFIIPVRRFDWDVYVGKINPVFGYEYRVQQSPDRMTVTPSLICRYTCGRQVGVKSRFKFLASRALILAVGVTNGSSNWEGFAFANEVDTNNFKTASGRLSYIIPVGGGLELGASGSVGAQDLQVSDDVYQWQWGADLHLEVRGAELTGEFVWGKVNGATEAGGPECGLAPCLDFKGTYGQLGYRVLNWLMPYARVDWRQALHRSGASFVYNSNTLRVTPGVRFDAGAHVIIKAEYVVNLELGRIPRIPNDVLTLSLVARL